MECKYTIIKFGTRVGIELIDTLWNVNICSREFAMASKPN